MRIKGSTLTIITITLGYRETISAFDLYKGFHTSIHLL